MKTLLHILRALVVLTIFVGAVWLLYGKLKDFDHGLFLASLRSITAAQMAAALALVVFNYVILMGYDYLALKYIRHPLPLKRLALASFIGNVSSFNFGSLFGGAAVRYRLYSAWKLTPFEILQLIAILGVTFWLGVLALAGVVFLVDPFPLPETLELAGQGGAEPIHVHLPFHSVRPLAVALLAIVAGYLVLCAVRRRPLKLFKSEIPLPPPRLSMAQIAVACADMVVAAAVFYVLLPADPGVNFLRFLGVFLLAWVVAAFAHVPAAAAVLEAVIIAFLCREGMPLSKEQAAAVLLVFRVIYYLLPLALAGALFIAHELLLGREFLHELRDRKDHHPAKCCLEGDPPPLSSRTPTPVHEASED